MKGGYIWSDMGRDNEKKGRKVGETIKIATKKVTVDRSDDS